MRSASTRGITAAAIADLSQGSRGRVPHVHVDVGEGGDEVRNRAGILERAEHHGGEVAHFLVRVHEQAHERGHRRLAPAHVDLHGRVAVGGVLAVAQRRLEDGQEQVGGGALEVGGGRLPHRPALVAHREQQGRDRLGPLRRSERVHHPAPYGLLARAERREGGGDVEGHAGIPATETQTHLNEATEDTEVTEKRNDIAGRGSETRGLHRDGPIACRRSVFSVRSVASVASLNEGTEVTEVTERGRFAGRGLRSLRACPGIDPTLLRRSEFSVRSVASVVSFVASLQLLVLGVSRASVAFRWPTAA